jgi:protocatechuate 3,4-dioxygenase beta subunit
VYLNTGDRESKEDQRDKNFQGFGWFTTGSTGEYRFRTIKPVPYPGRSAPHIHFKVKKGDRELLTSQINIAGHPGNNLDHVVLEGIGMFDRELLITEFKPIPSSKIGELAARFDIILGGTPDERARPSARRRDG